MVGDPEVAEVEAEVAEVEVVEEVAEPATKKQKTGPEDEDEEMDERATTAAGEEECEEESEDEEDESLRAVLTEEDKKEAQLLGSEGWKGNWKVAKSQAREAKTKAVKREKAGRDASGMRRWEKEERERAGMFGAFMDLAVAEGRCGP